MRVGGDIIESAPMQILKRGIVSLASGVANEMEWLGNEMELNTRTYLGNSHLQLTSSLQLSCSTITISEIFVSAGPTLELALFLELCFPSNSKWPFIIQDSACLTNPIWYSRMKSRRLQLETKESPVQAVGKTLIRKNSGKDYCDSEYWKDFDVI